MPLTLKPEDVDSNTDPSVQKQFDTETDKATQRSDFTALVDGLKIGLLTTNRPGLGPVSRSLYVVKREGPDFLFICNINSRKFQDIKADPNVSVNFQDSSTQNWASVVGTATTASNTDPRIKELFSKLYSAYFGDLGDGVHTGTAEDPRVALIEVKAKYIVYFKTSTGKLGFAKEVLQASFTGGVAQVGLLRELQGEDLEAMRKE